MEYEDLRKRDKMIEAAEYMELTLLIHKAISYHGSIRVLDFTPSAIFYRVTFWYHEKWTNIRENIIYLFLLSMQLRNQIITLDHGYVRSLSLRERIREFFERDDFVEEYVTFKVEMQDYDDVVIELKKALGIVIAPEH